MSHVSERIRGRWFNPERRYRPIQPTALVLGAVFVLIGVLGFVPGITTDLGSLRMTGVSAAALFGVFAASGVQNLINILFGVLFAGAAGSPRVAHWSLLAGGIVYLLFYGYGMLRGRGGDTDYLSLNTADNWLHLGMAVVLVSAALIAGRNRFPAESASPPASKPFTDV